MGVMLNRLWNALGLWFGVIETMAKAAGHLAQWCEESAGTFSDEARINRENRVKALEAAGITPSSTTAKPTRKATA